MTTTRTTTLPRRDSSILANALRGCGEAQKICFYNEDDRAQYQTKLTFGWLLLV